MQKSLTIISALSALQGLSTDAPSSDAPSVARAASDSDHATVLSLPLNAGARNIYAGHRSHSSHSSHSSHYSGSGGGYRYVPSTPAPSIAPSDSPRTAPAPAQLLSNPGPAPRPTADQLRLIIMRVQAALYSKGYDPGAIDGVLSSSTVAALRRYQAANHLTVSGAMSTETLSALGVSLAP